MAITLTERSMTAQPGTGAYQLMHSNGEPLQGRSSDDRMKRLGFDGSAGGTGVLGGGKMMLPTRPPKAWVGDEATKATQ